MEELLLYQAGVQPGIQERLIGIIYKERHLIENLFLKLKNHRRFSTRYEKKAFYFHAVVSLACILVWLL